MTVDSVEEPGEAEAEHLPAPRKNIPNTTFSWSGAMKYMLGLSMVRIPQEEKQHKACSRERGV